MNTTINNLSLDFAGAALRLKKIVTKTPLQRSTHLSKKYECFVAKIVTKTHLQRSTHLSKKYDCNVFLKREDLQVVRSYKLRGAYNMMSSLPKEQLDKGVVCASAGNHAQGFAFSCKKLNAKGVVFMPTITPNQKVKQTQMHGDGNVEIKLVGDTFDDCAIIAKKYTEDNGMVFIPPFDDYRIIEGQATVGV